MIMRNTVKKNKKWKNAFLWGVVTFCIFSVLVALTVAVVSVKSAAAQGKPIETREELLRAIRTASDGDVLLVGDVDFSMDGGGAKHESERLSIQNKSITLKSGKADGKAVFNGGSFLIDGTKLAGVFSVLNFENIIFNGTEDTASLTGADWDLSYDEGTGDPISNYTLKAQYAVMCKGNVQAKFTGCEFNGYMHEQGAAVRLFYNDYSLFPEYMAEVGDNATCQADLSFNSCSFKGNVALYGGGAVYAEANKKNVNLRFSDCDFCANVAGISDYSPGGGAIAVTDANVTLVRCRFNKNTQKYYDVCEEPYPCDVSSGGGVYCYACAINATECVFAENQASLGGAVALWQCTGLFESCIMDKNVATPNNAPEYKTLSSCGGLGGAIYCNNPESVLLLNTTLTRNVAENAYAALFTDYSANLEQMGLGARRLDLLFCTVADNVVNTAPEQFYYYGDETKKWSLYPWDLWAIPYLTVQCSVIIDETCGSFERYQTPTAENGYCYYAAPTQAEEDGYLRNYTQAASRISFSSAVIVPAEYVAELLPDKADGLGAVAIGASEAFVLPEEEEENLETSPQGLPTYTIVLILLGCVLLAAGGVSAIILLGNKGKGSQTRPTEKDASTSVVDSTESEKVSIDQADIDTILQNPVLSALSEREKDVLAAVLAGKKRKEIAETLFISESTVKKHIASIYTKIKVSSRTELLSKLYLNKH